MCRIPGCDCDSDDVMQYSFQCDEDNNEDNINFTQIETADKSKDEDVFSHVELFESFEKGLRWFEAQQECNST